MVTQEQLRVHTARRPFAPFWVRLADGETVYVTEPFRAVVTRVKLVVSPDGRDLRSIALDRISGHGVLTAAGGTTNEGSGRH